MKKFYSNFILSFVFSLICLLGNIFITVSYAQNVQGVKTPSTKQNWSDSYAVNGVCYCDSNFDHGITHRFVKVGNGVMNVVEICKNIESKFGSGPEEGRVYYNDIQCGNGPANNAPDETQCPGIAGSANGKNIYSGPRCLEKGPKWDLARLFGEEAKPQDSQESSAAVNASQSSESKRLNIEKDLVSLHHDMGPDKDDGHAATANYVLSSELGVNSILVGGTTTRGQSNNFLSGSASLLDDVWGEWINVNSNWEGSVEQVAGTWLEFIRNGGQIWVAEGGRSDFTADVITTLQDVDPSLDTKKIINVIQHSIANEENSTKEDLDFVKQNSNYFKIDDGNVSGKTAKLKGFTENFVQKALLGDYADKWKKAFDYLDPATEKLDFSDTVEFLYIVGIGTDIVSDVDSFANRLLGSSSGDISEAEAISSSDCVDVDGDGWGWDGSKSCEMPGEAAAAARNAIRKSSTIASQNTSSNSNCVDADGDGWGWDGSKSCLVEGSQISTSSSAQQNSTSEDCVDTDGDGWGWDGTKSCRVSSSQDSTSSNVQDSSSQPTGSTDFEGCIDTDGDGWGWDGNVTCNVSGQDVKDHRNNSQEESSPPIVDISTGIEPSTICFAVARTLSEAKKAFSIECPESSVSSRDCDPLQDGNWGCANISFDGVLPGYTLETNYTENNNTNSNSTNRPTSSTGAVSESQGGVIVLQAENTQSSLGKWERKTDIPGYTGSGHITFEGNRYMNGPADSPLTYSFKIEQAGVYELMMRVRRYNVSGHSDYANDGYIKMSGDFTSPVSKPSTQELKSNHKIFGGQLSWAWTGVNSLEIGGPKFKPQYSFKAGQTYTLTLSGRSKGWSVDKIVLFHQSVNRNKAQSADKSSTFISEEPQVSEAATQTTVISGDLGRASSNDLIVLHYDHAPDKDDGHALVAGRVLAKSHGFQPLVVHGAYGTNANSYVPSSLKVAEATWGSNFLNAHEDWDGAVISSFERWSTVLNNGGNIWIAEGGQSDITADIVKMVQSKLEFVNTKKRIFVIQHSKWNEDKTTSADLAFIKNNTSYSKIDDGNHGGNGTADLNMKSSDFVSKAKSSEFGGAWSAAFNYLDPNIKLDFSDTVELMYILDIPKSKISDVNDFADEYF